MPPPNPIQEYEYRYRQRKRDRERASHSKAFRYLLLFLILFPNAMMVILTIILVSNCGQVNFDWDRFFANERWNTVLSITYIPVFITFFTTPLYSFNLAITSMRRERLSNNWDLLRLTGISAHQYVWGKSSAIQRFVRNDYAYMTITRIIFALFFGTYSSIVFSDIFRQDPLTCNLNGSVAQYITLSAGIVIGSVIELGLSVSVGILLGMSALNSTIAPMVNVIVFIVLRFVSLIFWIAIFSMADALAFQSSDSLNFVQTLMSFLVTFSAFVMIWILFLLAQIIAMRVFRFNKS